MRGARERIYDGSTRGLFGSIALTACPVGNGGMELQGQVVGGARWALVAVFAAPP